MKLKEYDVKERRWDQWKEFYYCDHNWRYNHWDEFVQFETGEVVWVGTAPKPKDRTRYANNTQLIASRDTKYSHYRFETPDGEPVKFTQLHLNGSTQYLLIDLDTRVTVRLRARGTAEWAGPIPTRFRSRANVYFPGPGEPPIGSPVGVESADRLTKEQREHVKRIRASLTAWHEITEKKLSPWSQWDRNQPLPIETLLKVNSFTELDEYARRRFLYCGTRGTRSIKYYPYLTLKETDKAEHLDK